MRTTDVQKSILAGLVLIFCSCAAVNDSYQPDAVNKKTAKFRGDFNTWRQVPARSLQQAIARSKEKRVILNLHPVKYSNDPARDDFGLVYFFQDPAQREKNVSEYDSSFLVQAGWYIEFMRNRRVSMKDIPLGFPFEVDSSIAGNRSGLNFFFSLKEQSLKFFLLDGDFFQRNSSDSGGKCPPDCVKKNGVFSYWVPAATITSTGNYNLMQEPVLRDIICRIYKTKGCK